MNVTATRRDLGTRLYTAAYTLLLEFFIRAAERRTAQLRANHEALQRELEREIAANQVDIERMRAAIDRLP